jgi:effector-binding domain-containing protein
MKYDIELVDMPEQPAAVVAGEVDHTGISAFLGTAFQQTASALGRLGMAPAGPPFARYRVVDGGFEVEAGFPAPRPIPANGSVRPIVLPGGSLARTIHRGPYAEVGAAYQALEQWVVDNGCRATGEPWECYLDEPGVENPRTIVYFPCHTVRRD